MKKDSQHPHLGEIIARLLTERGMTKAEFGRRLNTSRQNVSLILQKRSLDTDLLWRIGDILRKDFFSLISFQQTGSNPSHGTVQMRLDFANQSLILLTTDKEDVFHVKETGAALPFREANNENELESAAS